MTFCKKLVHNLQKTPNYIALGFIWLYRTFISPFQTRNNCIFYPTCSQYAQECFKKYSFLKAFRKSVNRISRCHPGNEPRVDLP
jgi:putative membrane protein insertion efficiency factor